MYSALEMRNPVYSEPLWSGLDAIGIGLFMLDSEGNLVRLNNTAAKIFGVDPGADTGVRHISSIDAVMSLGLQEKLQSILGGTEKYCRHGISCTNTSGMYKELMEVAEEWFEKGILTEQGLAMVRAYSEMGMGRKEEFTQYFEQIKSTVTNYDKATAYFLLGDIDQGFIFLDKACEERSLRITLRSLKIVPWLDNFRNDPRYKKILRKMNLE